MTRTSDAPERLEELARRHLWLCFSQMGKSVDLPIIVRGEGCHVYDDKGKRYIDGLAGLFLSNVGHGRKELAEAAYEQMTQLHFFPPLDLRAPEGHRAGRQAEQSRSRRSQSRLLHHRGR